MAENLANGRKEIPKEFLQPATGWQRLAGLLKVITLDFWQVGLSIAVADLLTVFGGFGGFWRVWSVWRVWRVLEGLRAGKRQL